MGECCIGGWILQTDVAEGGCCTWADVTHGGINAHGQMLLKEGCCAMGDDVQWGVAYGGILFQQHRYILLAQNKYWSAMKMYFVNYYDSLLFMLGSSNCVN